MSFLDYTGTYKKRGDKYIFEMIKGKRSSKYCSKILNPTYENSFKNMFCKEESLLKSLLNSVLFPESKLIQRIEYSKIYFDGKGAINSRYGLGSKSLDIGCKCFIKKDKDLI